MDSDSGESIENDVKRLQNDGNQKKNDLR